MQENPNEAPHSIRWHLELGGDVIAEIADAHDYEFPWTYGHLVDSPAFERFRPFFTDDTTWEEDDPVIGELCVEVSERGGFALRDLRTGELHFPFSLNQRDETVWFRIGDTTG